VDPARVTSGLLDNLDSGVKLVEGLNPTTLAKSQKSEADAQHIRKAMEQDGAALRILRLAGIGLGSNASPN
jgi:Xaa-Pro aminopeptidase